MPKTLLLADDSVTIQKVVGITFANEDIRLVTENNGDSALARARESTPDIVLADVAMPGLNGYELCAAIKTDPRLAKVPVILLTGTFESYDEERTKEVGADGHISKPFEAQALVDLVHATLERAQSQSAAAPQAAAALGQTQVFSPDAALEVPSPAAVAAPATPSTPVPPAGIVTPPAQSRQPAETEFSFADFPAAEATPASGDATQFFDPTAGSAPQASPNDETALLDPRAALSPDRPGAPASVAPAPLTAPQADSVPVVQPPPESARTLDPGAAAELDALDLGDQFVSPIPGADARPSGETTWRLNEDTASEPALPTPAALAAEQALDEVSTDPNVRVVRATTDETLSELTWAEPLDESSATPARTAGMSQSTLRDSPSAQDTPTPLAIDPAHLHESLEKIAWEAFGPLSEQLVAEAVRKIEEIAQEVIPRVAERLVREEIAKLKAGR